MPCVLIWISLKAIPLAIANKSSCLLQTRTYPYLQRSAVTVAKRKYFPMRTSGPAGFTW